MWQSKLCKLKLTNKGKKFAKNKIMESIKLNKSLIQVGDATPNLSDEIKKLNNILRDINHDREIIISISDYNKIFETAISKEYIENTIIL